MRLKQGLLIAYLSLIPISSEADRSQPVHSERGSGSLYLRSRHEGERDLMALARTHCEEDLWFYASGKWYDAGMDEGFVSVRQDDSIIERVLRETTGPIFEYHTHNHDWCPDIEVDGISFEAISVTDVISHVALSDYVNRRGRRLFSRVADEHGIWSYTVNRALRHRLLEDINNDDVLRMRNDLAEHELELLNMPVSMAASKLQRYMNIQRRNGVLVSYRRLR